MMKKENIEKEEQRFWIACFRSMEEEIPEAEINQRWKELTQKLKKDNSQRKLRHIYIQVACTAAILLGVLFGTQYYWIYTSNPIEKAIASLEDSVTDTTRQVTLITHANERIIAGEKAYISYSQQGKTFVNKQQVEIGKQKTEYNQLIVPKGQSSRLILSDSTILYINAGTKLLYPSVFTDNKYREIYVDGEIFIEVKKNTKRPFIVKTPKFDVRVTGTAFNVYAYKSMNEAEVILLRGGVQVKDHAGHETTIKPNELLKLTDGITQSTYKVDASEYIAWTKGHFPLQGRSMRSILQRLGFYYGCEITCDDAVSTLSLQGTIDMSVPLIKVFERISKIHPINITQNTKGYHLTIDLNTNL